MFDDYQKKLVQKRIEVTYTQVEDIPVFPWEIGFFVNRMNTFYYKYEILNSISNAINSGVDPRDIVMLDKSLPYNNIYADFDILDLSDVGLVHLYKIGKLVSLIPNKKVYQLSLMLTLFHSTNEFLYSIKIKPYRVKDIVALWSLVNQDRINESIEYLESKVYETLRVKKAQNHKERFDGIVFEFSKRYALLDKDFVDLDARLPSLLLESSHIVFQKKIPKRIYNKYFEYFIRQFNKMSRPLVGIAYFNENKIRLLGRALVNKKLVNESTFELKEARRFSPLSDLFVGGTAIYSTIKSEKRATEKHEIEKEILELEREKAATEVEIARIKLLREKLALYKELDEIAAESDVFEYKKIAPGIARMQVHRAYMQVDQNKQALLTDSGMEVKSDSVHIIDLKV